MEASKEEWVNSEKNYWGALMIAYRTILASVVSRVNPPPHGIKINWKSFKLWLWIKVLYNLISEVEVGSSAAFSANSWVELPRTLFSREGRLQKISFELSTLEPNGLIFWYGQDPETTKVDDYLSIAGMY